MRKLSDSAVDRMKFVVLIKNRPSPFTTYNQRPVHMVSSDLVTRWKPSSYVSFHIRREAPNKGLKTRLEKVWPARSTFVINFGRLQTGAQRLVIVCNKWSKTETKLIFCCTIIADKLQQQNRRRHVLSVGAILRHCAVWMLPRGRLRSRETPHEYLFHLLQRRWVPWTSSGLA